MRVRLVLVLSIGIFADATFAAAQPSIGVVISVQGKAVVTDKANQRRSLQRGAAIYLYDKIVTQQNSKAQLRLNDDSVIVVQQSSEFYVSEFSFNKGSPHDNKYVGNLVKGMLINISGQGDTKNYQLNSPLTTIAFRGTGIATKLVTKGNALINQEVYVFQGYVAVTNRCENVIGVCESRSINIGVGQQVNAVVVNMAGKIQGYKSSGLLEVGGAQTITHGGSGSVSITCKGKG